MNTLKIIDIIMGMTHKCVKGGDNQTIDLALIKRQMTSLVTRLISS